MINEIKEANKPIIKDMQNIYRVLFLCAFPGMVWNSINNFFNVVLKSGNIALFIDF